MVESTGIFIPLSPPTSPHMASSYGTDHSDSDWKPAVEGSSISSAEDSQNMTLLNTDVSNPSLLESQKRPLLKTHKSFPYSLKTSGYSFANCGLSHSNSPVPQQERITISNIEEEVIPATEMPTVTYGGSAPASPVSRLTPPSPSGMKKEEEKELEKMDFEEEQIEEEEQKPALSAQELRAQKRKMKRFRLTHNQTRFLMSEFARQAHPDAAHRERLAREIPGLSARQVQVWFQNRRAKLKRLTTDDQERMMRSRALPEDFDMTQALHSPFGSTPPIGSTLTSPTGFGGGFGDNGMIRPLSIDTLRRLPEGAHISPSSITPSFGNFAFTPPQSATDTLSPVSASTDPNPFDFHSPPLEGRSAPFMSSSASAAAYPVHPQVPRLQIHDRMGRSRAEPIASPLRTSISYSGLNDAHLGRAMDSPTGSLDGTSLDTPHSKSMLNGSSLPWGSNYNYTALPSYSNSSRLRSYSGTMPRRIELSSYTSHARPSTSTSTPQSAGFPFVSSSSLGTPPGAFSLPPAPTYGGFLRDDHSSGAVEDAEHDVQREAGAHDVVQLPPSAF